MNNFPSFDGEGRSLDFEDENQGQAIDLVTEQVFQDSMEETGRSLPDKDRVYVVNNDLDNFVVKQDVRVEDSGDLTLQVKA